MKITIATSTGFHLRNLAAELLDAGHEVRFYSYLPKWKTRSYGLPDTVCTSYFWRFLPWSALALARFGGTSSCLLNIRESLFARLDDAIENDMEVADIFVGLSAIAVRSAQKAKAMGQLVLIERGATHIHSQSSVAQSAGAIPCTTTYVQRELASYDAADRIVVLSSHAKATFVEHGHEVDTVEIVCPGTDLRLFHGPEEPRTSHVKALYVGAWSKRKGADLFAGLLREIPDLTLSHIGVKVDVAFPKTERFAALGYMDHASLAAAMREHHVFIFPSRDDGFGMVLCEALACGMRVVATTSSGAPDIARLVDSNIMTIVQPDSLPSLVEGTLEQLSHANADKGASAISNREREKFGWTQYAERYINMIDRILATRR
ncbi:glycosyltransferase family 4 protein [Altererythrobacter aquiaggeris]|uniref:glycosyltransferase family 4 protein n=1 Tax=Aestuarierythrobacter aquiaggeris TaxID=1898396 RepID=UPI003015F8B7